LKFLGLEFDGNTFRAHTRKGSRLALTDKQKLLMAVQDKLVQDKQFNNIEEAIKFLETNQMRAEEYGPSGRMRLGGS
jgi:hypothetical protein